MRLSMINMIAAVLLFAATTATAVELSVLSAATVTVTQGDSITIDIALDNASETSNNGVVATLTGLNAAGAVVLSGQSASAGPGVPVHFTSFCTLSTCFGGIVSNDGGGFAPSDLSAGANYFGAGDDDVVLIQALAFSPGSGTGASDPGLAGVFGSHDPRDATITLQINGLPGAYVLTLGGFYSSGGNQPIATSGITVTIVPEPGTALLMGFGLAGLANAGRRESEKTSRRVLPMAD